jgi:hypothetical protein
MLLTSVCRAGYRGIHDHPHDRNDEHRHQPHPLRLPQREFHQGVQVHFLHQFSNLLLFSPAAWPGWKAACFNSDFFVRDKEFQQRRKKKKRSLDLDAHIVKKQDNKNFNSSPVNNPEFKTSIIWHWEICKEGHIKQC